jgi:hypothetical protein
VLGETAALLSGVCRLPLGVGGAAVSLGMLDSVALGKGVPTDTTGSLNEHEAVNVRTSDIISAVILRWTIWFRCFMRSPPLVPGEYIVRV